MNILKTKVFKYYESIISLCIIQDQKKEKFLQ